MNPEAFLPPRFLVNPTPGRYDLVVSIEVLGHMHSGDGAVAIANICRSTDDVLFSFVAL